MPFNSLEFVPFLLIVLIFHFALLPASAPRGRKIVLVIASYGFYMSWNPFFGLLLLFSTLLDFNIGWALTRVGSEAARRALVTLSLVANLGLLGVFKYGAFFAASLSPWLPSWDGAPLDVALRFALPVGISFYTFQTLSYTIDIYRRRFEPTRSLLDFSLYISFFPQLVAGPIVRPHELLPQLAAPRQVAATDVEYGLARITTGLVKKVVFADTLGALVDSVFDAPSLVSWPIQALAIYAYAFQIYYDFSGYTDMAIGLARLFGIRLPENFDRPYLATSPRDFWRRWHISLSTWLRDYLYISLGGNRRGVPRMYVNLGITMLLGGLWHGAGWNFIAWGAYHGALLIGQRAFFGNHDPSAARTPRWLRQVVTFHLICFGWLLFRSPGLGAVGRYLTAFGEGQWGMSSVLFTAIVLLVVSLGLHVVTRQARLRDAMIAAPALLQGCVHAVAAILIFLFSSGGQRFIYFQF